MKRRQRNLYIKVLPRSKQKSLKSEEIDPLKPTFNAKLRKTK